MSRNKILITAVAAVLALGVAALVIKGSPATDKNGSQTAGTQASQANTTPYTFKELGVKVNLPADIKDLTYDPPAQKNLQPTSPVALSLKLKSFTDLANKCLLYPANSFQSFANIVKMPGNYDTMPYHIGNKLVQLDKFYIVDVGSSLPKDFKCKDESTKAELTQMQSDLDTSLKQAFSSAQKV